MGVSPGRVVPLISMLSLGTGCERTPLPAAPALSPAPRTRPPPDVDPAALPACGKDMSQEPLAAICALSRPARDLAIGCAEPEEIMGVRVDQARLHQVGLSVPAAGAAADGDLLQTATEGEAPQPNTIVEPKPISGTVAAAEVSVVAADEAAGVALVAGWRAQLENWGCVAAGEPEPAWVELQCGRFEVLLDYLDVTGRAYVKAMSPGVAACWKPTR